MQKIKTPWGDINPSVSIFPVQYLLILYGIIYFLPFDIFKIFFKGEDSFIEWLQFLGYFFSFLICIILLFSKKRDRSIKQTICWLLLTLFCFYVAGEEISWAERITTIGSDSIREINIQRETNIHNLKGLNNYLHFSFISTGIFFGWVGWKIWPNIEALPSKKFSLFFLIVAAFYSYFDLSWITLGERIRNDQEAIEFLMSSGLFLHCYSHLKEKLLR
tara:strand:- start:54 stop:707 length:654 start_codon:yes stop_codon:yes gene_type:complete